MKTMRTNKKLDSILIYTGLVLVRFLQVFIVFITLLADIIMTIYLLKNFEAKVIYSAFIIYLTGFGIAFIFVYLTESCVEDISKGINKLKNILSNE